jgi:hypothetical protein
MVTFQGQVGLIGIIPHRNRHRMCSTPGNIKLTCRCIRQNIMTVNHHQSREERSISCLHSTCRVAKVSIGISSILLINPLLSNTISYSRSGNSKTLNTPITRINTIQVRYGTCSEDSASSEVEIDCAVGQRISDCHSWSICSGIG